MRTLLIAFVATAAVWAGFAGPAQAHWPPGPAPLPGGPRPRPPIHYPGYPGYPGPIYPPPRPRPPAVEIRYTVHYRPAPYAGWRVYGSYSSHARAAAAARRLEARGYETDVVVTYGRR